MNIKARIGRLEAAAKPELRRQISDTEINSIVVVAATTDLEHPDPAIADAARRLVEDDAAMADYIEAWFATEDQQWLAENTMWRPLTDAGVAWQARAERACQFLEAINDGRQKLDPDDPVALAALSRREAGLVGSP